MKLRKRLGQHLLIDSEILKLISEVSGAREGVTCLEIGPGTGLLTAALLERGARVTAVEMDERMVAVLKRKHRDESRLEIIQGDVLKVDFNELIPPEARPAVAVGNLPYYISSPIVFRLLDHRELFSCATILVQKEVGARMTAGPGSRDYGRLSIFCQVEAECEMLFDVGRELFRPPPRVDSTVVRLVPRPRGEVPIDDVKTFDAIVHGAFEHRRKTLWNSMRMSIEKGRCRGLFEPVKEPQILLAEAFEAAGVKKTSRPEEIEILTYVALSDHLSKSIQ